MNAKLSNLLIYGSVEVFNECFVVTSSCLMLVARWFSLNYMVDARLKAFGGWCSLVFAWFMLFGFVLCCYSTIDNCICV